MTGLPPRIPGTHSMRSNLRLMPRIAANHARDYYHQRRKLICMTTEASSGQSGFMAPTREPRVGVLYTGASTVVEDVGRVMDLAGYQQHLPQDRDTLLKVNISWQHYYPGCSTSPWQLDGVATKLEQTGYGNITPVQNGTV